MTPKSDTSLLDRLTEELQCLYLSDLKRAQYRADLVWLVRSIPAEEYPVREWRDALSYLTGLTTESEATAKTLKNQLLSRLKKACMPP